MDKPLPCGFENPKSRNITGTMGRELISDQWMVAVAA
jgi:hypothetical protein